MRVLCLVLLAAGAACALTYHVSLDGIDSDTRDGRSATNAWRTLAYACERTSSARDTVRVGAGSFVETRPSVLHDSMTVLGLDTARTRVSGAGSWTIGADARLVDNNRSSYIISAHSRSGVTVSGISFSSADTTRRLHGALWFFACTGVTIRDCAFTEFYWNGTCLLQSGGIDLHHCRYHNAAQQKDQWTGGQILVRWIRDSDIHDNVITRDKGEGYGYKAQDAGHRNVQIRNNSIMGHYFAIESAHDQEYELDIHHNEFDGCVSVPKWEGGPQTLPAGTRFAVRIHHNLMHDSYGIEGPRNHLVIDSNYVFITKTGGRFYTQHLTSVCLGPVSIHHNVIVNIDRGFVWAHNAGKAHGFIIEHNTVYCADAGSRTESVLAIPDTASNWILRNNIIVAHDAQPRALYNSAAKGAAVVRAEGNVLINVSGAPSGNWSQDPGLRLSGDIPHPYYAPASNASFVVDRGVDAGYAYDGLAPDIGAYEFRPLTAPAVAQPARHALTPAASLTTDLLGRTSPVPHSVHVSVTGEGLSVPVGCR